MINKLFEYINDKKLKITYQDNCIDIINYNKVLNVEDNKIKLDCFQKYITIKGTNLLIIKMYDEELLIKGNIKELIMEDYND